MISIENPKFLGEKLSLYAFRDVHNWNVLEQAKIPVPLLKKFCERKGIPYPLDTQEEREQRGSAAACEGAGQQVAGAGEVIGGLTVAEVRQVMERHPVLADVVKATAIMEATPADRLQNSGKSPEEVVEANLGRMAARNGWGSGKTGGLGGEQWKQLRTIIFGLKQGGRPSTKTV